MKIIFNFLTIAILSFVFTSCEDVVQIKLDEGSKLYVVDAFVNDLRQAQIVKVTTNDSYFSNREAPEVANANVVLMDLTANISYNFTYGNKGNYILNLAPTDTVAKVGHNYMLNVTIDGFTYTSLTTQKRTASIDSIGAYEGEPDFGGKPGEFNCLLFAKDRVDPATDYYWVRTFKNDTLFSGSDDLNICIDGTGGAITTAPSDSIDFSPPANFLGFKTYLKNDKCKVEIHSISRETYFFFLQATAQILNGGLFATTPENVKTNIVTPKGAKTKAVGWFNMATVSAKTKLVQ